MKQKAHLENIKKYFLEIEDTNDFLLLINAIYQQNYPDLYKAYPIKFNG